MVARRALSTQIEPHSWKTLRRSCIGLCMATAGKLTFLPRLESLRGIAAVAVVGYHVLGLAIDTSVTGMAPVVLFFVLSGFVLARSLANDSNPVDFLWHRVFRLFPAAAAVV